MVVVSSCRGVGLSAITSANPYRQLLTGEAGDSGETASVNVRKVGMTSNLWPIRGDTCYNGGDKGSHPATG